MTQEEVQRLKRKCRATSKTKSALTTLLSRKWPKLPLSLTLSHKGREGIQCLLKEMQCSKESAITEKEMP
jgi:hypothetical protein